MELLFYKSSEKDCMLFVKYTLFIHTQYCWGICYTFKKYNKGDTESGYNNLIAESYLNR